MNVYLVQQWCEEKNHWEISGVFNTQEQAILACRDDNYCILKMVLNEQFPHESIDGQWMFPFHSKMAPIQDNIMREKYNSASSCPKIYRRIFMPRPTWTECLFSKKKKEERERWDKAWGKLDEVEYIIPVNHKTQTPTHQENKNTENDMSKWITDRRPTLDDSMQKTVFAWIDGKCTLAFWDYVSYANLPWQPISKPEPYVKPKRFVVKRMMDIYSDIESCGYCVYNNIGGVFAKDIPTREAAERIAAIYEEVMP